MQRLKLSVTALIKELARLSTVAILAATVTQYGGIQSLIYLTETPVEIETQVDLKTPASMVVHSTSKLAPTHSLRPQSPSNATATTNRGLSGNAGASVTMANQHAVRNLSISESLKGEISTAVAAVYGPGFAAQVYSGGQHDQKTAQSLGVRRFGTKAHDHGHAADLYIINQQGKRVTGDALAPLAQYWLASGLGGVGLEMKGGGIHLDERRVRFWDYAKQGGSITKVQRAAFVAGKRGVMPSLHSQVRKTSQASATGYRTEASHSDATHVKASNGRTLTPIFDLLGQTEGTDVGDGYNETLAYGAFSNGDVILTDMTLAQIDRLQTQMLAHPDNNWNSSAIGRYQIVRRTLRQLRKNLHLEGTAKFTPSLQDLLATELLRGRGLEAWKAGRLSDRDFATALSKEWASLPNPQTGKGYYSNQRAAVGSSAMQGVLDQVRALHLETSGP